MNVNEKIKEVAKTTFNGVIIGASMLLPGISGGTMAIMLGIYDKMISAVSQILKTPKQSIIFLLQIAVGGAVGMVAFSNVVLTLIESFYVPMLFLFMGAIVGTVPLLYRKTKAEKFAPTDVIFVAVGLGLLLLLKLVPQGLFDITGSLDFMDFLILLLGGFGVSLALVLPGISVSYTFVLLGMYDRFIAALKDLDILFLLPLGLGLIAGIFLTARALEKAMARFARQTYLIISGFVLASVFEIFPYQDVPQGYNIAICVGTLVLGFLITFFLGKFYAEE